jgi:hypothetical protein
MASIFSIHFISKSSAIDLATIVGAIFNIFDN